MTFFGSSELHGLNGVAGIDRALESVGRDDFADLGNLHHVEERCDPRHDVFAVGGRGREDRFVGSGERNDKRRGRLCQHVLVGRRIGEQHFLDAVELGSRVGDRLAVMTGDQDMHVGADLLGGGQRLGGRILERLVVVLGEEKTGIRSPPLRFSVCR